MAKLPLKMNFWLTQNCPDWNNYCEQIYGNNCKESYDNPV